MVSPHASASTVGSSSSNNDESSSKQQQQLNDGGGLQYYTGWILAGVASTMLTTVFGLFHVDVFLRVYNLPLSTYAKGNFVFSFINTANDVAGAWMVDTIASLTSSRSSAIGLAGCLFAVAFLSPFFRWTTDRSSNFSAGVHFVTAMSLYDTMYSFVAILTGSVITDNHQMSDQDRAKIMVAGKVANLIASMLVARVGLGLFRTSSSHNNNNNDNDNNNNNNNMQSFRGFVVWLSLAACGLYCMAHFLMSPVIIYWKSCRYRKRLLPPTTGIAVDDGSYYSQPPKKKAAVRRRKLRFRQVVKDFWSHPNFRYWVLMEMLLEGQQSFLSSFLKTFVDRLVVANHQGVGIPRKSCDWFLSVLNPMKQIAGIAIYIPIRRLGYREVYMRMFRANLFLSLFFFAFASPSDPYLVLGFLFIHTVMTGSVQGAGFHLAMSDMVLEMKCKHAGEGRFNEPSLAGLFMGANALLCKPMESFLPIVAALFLEKTDFSNNQDSDSARWVLFNLLAIPVICFSCLQILSWRNYSLHSERTEQMRNELEKLVGPKEEVP